MNNRCAGTLFVYKVTVATSWGVNGGGCGGMNPSGGGGVGKSYTKSRSKLNWRFKKHSSFSSSWRLPCHTGFVKINNCVSFMLN